MVAAAPSESGTVLSGKDGSSETASSEETSIHPRGKRTESNGAGDNDGATITGMSAHGSSYLTDHHRRSSAAQATPVTFSQLVRHSRSIDEERDASRMERYFWRIANLVCILPLYLRFHWFKEQRVSIILEFFACYVHLWLLPMQAGFEWAQRPATYAFAYVLDVIILFARVRELVIKMRNFHSSRVSRRKQHRYVLELVKVGIVFPYDAFMMMHGEMPVSTISEIRLMKMLWMLPQLHQCMVFLERSQSVPFFFARLARVLHIFFLNTHWLCCIFRWLSTDDNAKHYATARWTGDGDAPINQYMRATYWSMMTLTTTGHVDIINEDGTEAGAHWETIWAILVVILATFVYIYVNANFTSLILRLNTQLETYRTRLQGVDSYLQRNKVSRELRRAVKRHFTHTFTQGADADQSLIEQMPHALRRAVLADIYMVTLRKTPLFFGCPKLLTLICTAMRRSTCLQGDVLAYQGDVVTELYILESGELQLAYHKDEGQTGDGAAAAEENAAAETGGDNKSDDLEKSRDIDEFTEAGDSVVPDDDDVETASVDARSVNGRRVAYTTGTKVVQAQRRTGQESVGGVESRRKSYLTPTWTGSLSSTGEDPPFMVRHLQHPGQVACEAAFFFGMRQQCTVQALSVSSCLVITRADFLSVSQELQDEVQKTKANAVSQLKEAEDPSAEEIERQQRAARPRHEALTIADLLFAAAKGEVETVRQAILKYDIDVNIVDYEGRTALHVAASAGQLAVVEFLMAHRAALNTVDVFGKTALQNAIKLGHRAVADSLSKAGAKLEWTQTEAAAELCAHARDGKISGVTNLLIYGAPVNAADYDGRTCLHVAASEGNMPIVQFLVSEANAHVNCKDRWGNTPLAEAIRSGHVAVTQHLIRWGGRLLWDMMRASSELNERARQSDSHRIDLLLQAGCPVNAADYDKRTCLHLAASEGVLNVVEMLVAKRANVNVRDRWGGTPLRDAVKGGHSHVAKYLRDHGAQLGFDEVTASSELCELARNGQLDVLKLMLACGAPVDAADYDQRTCLHLAASEGNLPIVQFLINDGGANINSRDRWDGTPLADAIRHRNAAVTRALIHKGASLGWDDVRSSGELCELGRQADSHRIHLLLEAKCSVDACDYDKRTCLHLACAEGALKVVEVLVEHGANVNLVDRWGGTALSESVKHGHEKVALLLMKKGATLGFDEVTASSELCELARKGSGQQLKLLLACGAPVDAADYDQRTCLHLAASEGNLPIVQLLMEVGAHISAKDRWGGTPLADAIREGHSAVTALFIKAGASLGWDQVRMSSELNELARQGYTKRIELLLEASCHPDAADYDRRTCLHLAASEGAMNVVEVLVNSGASLNQTDRWGSTPLYDAVRAGHKEVAHALRRFGAEMRLPDLTTVTQLSKYAMTGESETLQLYLQAGANVNAMDWDRRTALHVAAACGHKSAVKVLIQAGAKADLADRWGRTPKDNDDGNKWEDDMWVNPSTPTRPHSTPASRPSRRMSIGSNRHDNPRVIPLAQTTSTSTPSGSNAGLRMPWWEA